MTHYPAQSEADIVACLLTDHNVQSCEIVSVLKNNNLNQVLQARVNDRDVVIKVFHAQDRARTIENLQSELKFLSKTMSSGSYQVNQCLHAFPENGIVVLSHAQGRPVGSMLNHMSPSDRFDLMRECGKWLQTYTRLRTKNRKLGTKKWLDTLSARSTDHIHDPSDKDLLNRLFKCITAQAERIQGCEVVRAATHGDFAGANLHYDNGTLIGVDIQTESWLAIASDAAQFLVFSQMQNDSILTPLKFGIAEPDWTAFLMDDVISAEEQETTLPFFIGCKLYTRFISVYDRKRVRRNLDHAIEGYLLEPSFASG